MKTLDFLKFLQSKLGGEFDYKSKIGYEDTSSRLSVPRLVLELGGEHIRFEIMNKTELYINVYTKPPHFLKIRHENFATKLLDKIHLHSEVKIGDTEFDDKYIIEFAKKEIIQKTMNSTFKECITNLEPFKRFEMTKRDYILLKDISLKKYDVEDAEHDIRNMLKIVASCKKVWREEASNNKI